MKLRIESGGYPWEYIDLPGVLIGWYTQPGIRESNSIRKWGTIMRKKWIGLLGIVWGFVSMNGVAAESNLPRLRDEFISPPRTCTQVPFWFWNDEIAEAGILEQIEWMTEHGVYGFLPHARMGLSKEVGYMTGRWLELVRYAVEQASQRGMMVYLYDEGMYPSGSAHGKVVEGRPDLASQGLRQVAIDCRGPNRLQQSWPLEEREKAVASVLVKKAGEGTYHRPSVQVIPLAESISVDIPEGDWTLFLFIQTPSGGVIRGVHWDEEDNQPNAPPASDLLNPEVAKRFIEFTHEKYYAVLKDHFGTTVRGMFTDEPSILAKRSKRGLQPWSGDFLHQMNKILGYDFTPLLPLLWVKAEDGFESVARLDYQYAIDELLNKNYYAPLSDWCEKHGIALTGHPSGAGDIPPQIYFHEPGQDVVWRWVLPGKTSLEGDQSTLGKSAASVAAQLQRPVVINECYGAFGWRLSMDEMKWLADWLFVRGSNRLFPHAFYYSVREQRIFERPPDLSWHNLWADHYALFSRYTNRLSWLQSDSRAVAPVAVLTVAGHTPWAAAKALFQNQIDFHYLDETLLDRVELREKTLNIGEGKYDVLILDGIHTLAAETARKLIRFLENGITVLALNSALELHPLRGTRGESPISKIKQNNRFRACGNEEELVKALRSLIRPSAIAREFSPDLRAQHRIKAGVDFYLLTNEGEEVIDTTITISGQNKVPEIWNAEDGSMQPARNARLSDRGVDLDLKLPSRQSAILVFHSEFPSPGASSSTPVKEKIALPLPNEGWELTIAGKTYSGQALGDWTAIEELRSFSGIGWYALSFNLPEGKWEKGKTCFIDLGDVQSWAQVEINGRECGVRLWKPFVFDVSNVVRAGENRIRIGIANTRANELTEEKLPSGLFGPVAARIEP